MADGAGGIDETATAFGPLDDDALRAEAEEAGRAAAAAAAPAPISAAEVARIVPDRAAPPPATTAYRLALAFVAAVGTLLALLYLALVAAAFWALWFHFTHNSIGLRDRESTLSVKTDLMVTFGIVVLLLMMLRPLLPAKRGASSPVTVAPGEEPALHAFVQRVARAVAAPVPVRIDVDADVNASASFRRGVRSFGADDLVLTVGAPLLAGTTVEEFASVVAHELGHFRQGAGMRLTYVASTLESWFARVAHQRDRLDEIVARIGWSLGPIQLLSWMMRKLFQAMHWMIQRAERLASRRMEIDADDHSLALVGGPATASAFRKLVLLDAAHSAALQTAQSAYEKGRLPDDLPALVLGWRARMPADAARGLIGDALAERTSARATHPCMRERAERAAARPAGPMRCDAPARTLLRDPEGLFRETTRRHLAAVTDGASAQAQVVPSADLLGAADENRAARDSLARWSQGVLSYLVLPRTRDWLGGAPASRDDALAEVRAARDELVARAAAARTAVATFDAADTRVAHALRVEAVLGVNGAVRKIPDVPSVTDRTPEGVQRILAEARAAERGARATVDLALAALGRRCRAGLALLDGDDATTARALASRLAAADGVLADGERLRERLSIYTGLAREAGELKNKRAGPALALFADGVRADIESLRSGLAAAAPPVSAGTDGDGEPSLPTLPALDASATADVAFETGRAALGALYSWWFDTAMRLAVRLEAAETAAGLASLPEPGSRS